MTKRWWISLIAAAAVTGLTTGCQQETSTSSNIHRLHGEVFRPQEEPRAVDNLSFAQAAAGARDDSTLYGSHFDSHGLNSLGRAKLALMLRSEEPIDPLIVFLDLPSEIPAEPAHSTVTDYLKSRGLADSQIKLVDGANPATIHPAAPTAAADKTLSAINAPSAGPSGANGGSAPAGYENPVPPTGASAGTPTPSETH